MTTAHRLASSLAVTLVLATGAATASARPFDLDGNGSYMPAPSASVQAPNQGTAPTHAASGSPMTVRVVARDSGFDWGDAGIGAAGGVALSMIGVGGALSLSHHRTRRPRHATGLAN